MAQNKRPGNLNDLPPEIRDELIRIERDDKANSPEAQTNTELVKNLANTTQAINTLMNSLGIAVMGLQQGMDSHSKQALEALVESNTHLKGASEALGASDQSGNFNNVVQALDKISHEIQLKLKDVEDAAKTKPEIKPQINVEAPKVDVKAPAVNLKPLEQLMNDKLPAVAKQLADAIPEVPETDLTQVEKLLKKIQNATEATANRKIPIPQFPTTVKVVNPDGTPISGGGGGGSVTQGTTPWVTSSQNTVDAAPTTQNITARDVGSTTVTTNANNQSVTTGSPTAGSVASFTLGGYDSARIQVTGTWTGTLVAQISLDGGTTWYNQGIHETGTSYTVSSFTANFSGHTNAAGGTNWRLQSTTAWTGTATVKVVASVNSSSVYVANNLKISDSTTPSIAATVKAASTPPTATDPALVVSISPNSIATTLNSELPDVTGTFTNATQTTALQATGLNGYDNVFVSISGTYTAATATFQGSDDGGATWKNIAVAARTDSQTIESGYTSLSNIARGWNINIQGFDAFQVLSSAVATGTVNVRISPESAPTNAGATVGVASLGDGVNNLNILKSDGTAAGQNAQLVAPSYRELTGLSAAALNADLVSSTDVSNTPFVALSILASAYSGTLTFQGSNDNFTTVHAVPLTRMDSTTSGTSGSTSANSLAFGGYVGFRYFRVRMTTYVSGTAQGVLELKTIGATLGNISNQGGTWTVGSNSSTGSAVPANAFYLGVGNGSANLIGLVTQSAVSDASGAANTLATGQQVYNGSLYDRMRNNTTAALIAAGTTSTQTGITLTTYNASRATFLVNIASGAGTVTVVINETSSSGYSTNILTSTALVGVGTTALRIFPAATPTANLVANDMLPRNISVTATVVGTISFGIDVNLGR